MIAAYVALWDRREPPTVLALVRILVAAALLADYLTAGALGLVEAVWAPPPMGLGYGAIGGNAPATVRWLGASPETARLVWAVATGCAFLLLVGALTRVAALGFVLASAQLAMMAPDSDRGIDILLRIVVFVLAFSGANARWSVDAWVRGRLGRPAPELVPAWPRYLLFAQLVWMYFSAAIAKQDPAWGPLGGFSALGSILSDPHFARWDGAWVASLYPLTQVATVATMAFEWGAAGFLLVTWLHATRDPPGRVRRLSNRLRLRWVWLVTGLGFHLGIAVTMRLGIFPFGVLAVWPVFFHPDELARAQAWARGRARRRLLPSEPP